ncbi:MAG TPA: recombinase [Thermohalobaculum sp.]|nr:recombinase [Thermohalobaculum sp.]
MHRILGAVAAAAAFTLAAPAAPAAQAACDPGTPGAELSYEQAQEVYACLSDELHEGYMQGDKRWIPAEFVRDYRDWTPVSTLPANPGFHGGRFLLTFVNDAGAEEYLKFLDERGPMPAGTLIAKESFSVNDAGKVEKGPLFLMQKVEAGVSPETGDWYYMAVAPNGTPMAVDVIPACNECHQGNFGYRDGLGYPVPEVRAGP